jgi:hypothetical protein
MPGAHSQPSKGSNVQGDDMKYRVHRLEVGPKSAQETLEAFLNQLTGEVVAVIPYVLPTFRAMGATSRTAFLLVVERVI